MKEIICSDLSALPAAAKEILASVAASKVFAFDGEMGAGKTTLIKELCKQLGSTDHASSPTFSIVNEYSIPTGAKIYHFDFYRIKDEQEAFDMGYEEYLYSGNYCFIEWPQKIGNLLPGTAVNIKLDLKDNTRLIKIY